MTVDQLVFTALAVGLLVSAVFVALILFVVLFVALWRLGNR